MIRWIFIDIGNVLFNDDPQTYYIHQRYFETAACRDPSLTFTQFLTDREHEVRIGNRWPTQTVMLRYLSRAELDALYHQVTDELRGIYDRMNFPMPHVQEMLDELAGRYRLGIIANQVVECRASLERRGLLDYLDVLAISEELNLHKPDPALFRWALNQCGVRPDEAVMVGDRHDNDIVPAATLGMHSIWVRWPSLAGKGWDPPDPEARAFVASHEREPFYGRVTQPEVEPSGTVSDLRGVAPTIDRLTQAMRPNVAG